MASSSTSSKRRRNQALRDYSSASAVLDISAVEESDLDDSFTIPSNDDNNEKVKLQKIRRRKSLAKNVVEEDKSDQPVKSAVANLNETDRLAHYNLCIKLAQENKVNSKNAFDLHVVDYLTDLVKKRDTPNFQMASMALQAGAHIFAARVDVLHSNALNTASGLAVKKGKKSSRDDEDLPDEEIPPENIPRRSVKRRKTKKFIAENLDTINYTKLETLEMPQAKFNSLSKAFEDCGLNGLMFQLPIKDDTCKVMLCDSSTYLRDKAPCISSPSAEIPVEILQGMHEKIIQNEGLQTFPSLREFSFFKIKFPLDDDMTLPFEENPLTKELTSALQKVVAEEGFDESLHTSFPPDMCATPGRFDLDDGADFSDMPNHDDDMGMVESFATPSAPHIMSTPLVDGRQTPKTPPFNQDSRYIPPTPSHVRQVPIEEVINRLSRAPSDYSCFDPNMELQVIGENILRGKAVRFGKRESKPPLKRAKLTFIDFDDLASKAVSLDKKFAAGKKTVISNGTIEKWDPLECLGLPPSNYDRQKLMELFTMPMMRIAEPKDADQSHHNNNQPFQDGEAEGCNYEDDGGGDFVDDNHCGSPCSESREPGYEISLINAPEKVKKDIIGFAKIAKKIDVKEVKRVLWQVLRERNDSSVGNVEDSLNSSEIPEKMTQPVDFLYAYYRMLHRLSAECRENISIPIAFVALLHLTNENNLFLKASEDMRILTVMQD